MKYYIHRDDKEVLYSYDGIIILWKSNGKDKMINFPNMNWSDYIRVGIKHYKTLLNN
jgi:hypothetical protein